MCFGAMVIDEIYIKKKLYFLAEENNEQKTKKIKYSI